MKDEHDLVEGSGADETAPAVPSEPAAAVSAAGLDATAAAGPEAVVALDPDAAGAAPVEAGAGGEASADDGGRVGVGEPGIGGAGAASEKLLRARQVVKELCARLGAEVEVEIRDSAETIACNVRVLSGGEVFEVGPRGQVLEALQYLVNRMVNRDAEGRKWITVEIGAFRETSTDPAMEEMARRLGEAAKRIGKTLTVVPIQARDRRVVHQVISEMEGLRTRSEGDGLLRRLLIEPTSSDTAED